MTALCQRMIEDMPSWKLAATTYRRYHSLREYVLSLLNKSHL